MDLCCVTCDGVDAAVDDDSAGLDPVAADHARSSDGDHKDVGGGAHGLQVGRLRVANGHGGVGHLEQLGHRRADELRAAEHDGVLALDGHLGRLDELEAALGRARHERLVELLMGELAGVDQIEAVDVLGRIDGVDHAVRVDVGGAVERQLHDDAAHARVRVELADRSQQLHLAHRALELDVTRHDADVGRRLELVANVDGRVFAIANLLLLL